MFKFHTHFDLRVNLLNIVHHIFPFNIKAELNPILKPIKLEFISCLIPTARNTAFLDSILSDLTKQNLNKDSFEVIILNSSTNQLENALKRHEKLLNLKLLNNPELNGLMGNIRNELLMQSQGEFILFLDDDTRILQKNFLEEALKLFNENTEVIQPFAIAISPTYKPHYTYIDPHSFATRCCLYRRSILEKLGGFHQGVTNYDDIDLGIRLYLVGAKIIQSTGIHYHHPAIYFESMLKPITMGQSIFKLKKFYPIAFWILMYLNALRFLPLILIPTPRNRQLFKISLGVLIGPFIPKKPSFIPIT